MIRAIRKIVQAAWSAGPSLLRDGGMGFRGARNQGRPAGAAIGLEIADALSVYLGGNRDASRLRVLAAQHPDEVLAGILQYQAIVGGQRDELCELTLVLGYVVRWCQEMRSADVAQRRKAFSNIAAVAHYEPVRRLLGSLPEDALGDADPEIRLDAARILLSSGDPAAIAKVFEGALADTPEARLAIAGQLVPYAVQLCHDAIPRALQSENPLEALRLLISWERALPLPDVRPLAGHSDPEVRAEIMRLLAFLPTTAENRAAIISGLGDEDDAVSTAAAASVGRLRLPGPDSLESPSPDGGLQLVQAGGGDEC